MNSSRGIFEPQEGFAPAPPAKSPFAVADEGPATSPFAIVSEPESPFAAMKDDHPTRLATDPGRPVKLPERRPAAGEVPAVEARSPFAAEPSNPSPFDAPAQPSSPFASSPPPVPAAAPASSPFGFAEEPAAPVTSPAPAAVAAAAAAALAETAPAPAPAAAAPAPAATPAPAAAPAPAPAPSSTMSDSTDSDSSSIRQLALRAIFGVDRELGAEEMLQRARGLSGIRHVARVPGGEVATVDAFKKIINNLGFPAGQVKLMSGNLPIDFIREGNVVLAIQNDGSFAPGVKETLIIVARELAKL